jgi:hypothetical protein
MATQALSLYLSSLLARLQYESRQAEDDQDGQRTTPLTLALGRN